VEVILALAINLLSLHDLTRLSSFSFYRRLDLPLPLRHSPPRRGHLAPLPLQALLHRKCGSRSHSLLLTLSMISTLTRKYEIMDGLLNLVNCYAHQPYPFVALSMATLSDPEVRLLRLVTAEILGKLDRFRTWMLRKK
jgi:hypothetical protein